MDRKEFSTGFHLKNKKLKQKNVYGEFGKKNGSNIPGQPLKFQSSAAVLPSGQQPYTELAQPRQETNHRSAAVCDSHLRIFETVVNIH